MDYPTAILAGSAVIGTVIGAVKIINGKKPSKSQSIATCNEIHAALVRELVLIKEDIRDIRNKLWEGKN